MVPLNQTDLGSASQRCCGGAGAGVSSGPAFLHGFVWASPVTVSLWWGIICWWETAGLLRCWIWVAPDLELPICGLGPGKWNLLFLMVVLPKLGDFYCLCSAVEGSNPRPASCPASCSPERQKPEPGSRALAELLPLPARDQLKHVPAASQPDTVTSQVSAPV